MKKRWITVGLATFLLLLPLLAYGQEIGIKKAIEIATQKVPDDVIKVEFERGIYEVKIRTPEGSISKVYVDGRDGSIVKLKRGYYEDDEYRRYRRYDDDD